MYPFPLRPMYEGFAAIVYDLSIGAVESPVLKSVAKLTPTSEGAPEPLNP